MIGDIKIGNNIVIAAGAVVTKSFTEEQMMQAVDATFKEVDLDQDGFISLDEFREMVIRHPCVIESLTISNDFCLL